MTLLDALQQILQEEGRTGLQIDFIVQRLKMYPEAIEGLETDEAIKAKAGRVLNKESGKRGSSIVKIRRGTFRFIKRRDPNALPQPKPTEIQQGTATTPVTKVDSLFFGRGGEYSVLGELLFNGYNANVMAVDEGIDIYATKNNLIYFVQVKTTTLNEKKTAYFTIKRSAFTRTEPSQVRYILVIRCGNGEMRYFTFQSRDIERFISDKLVNGEPEKETLNINIRYEDDNRPYLYRENKSQDVSFYQNNFNL